FRGCLIKFISIYNNSGSLVDSYAVNNSESVSLNFSQQNSGVYYYKAFTSAGEFVSGKFILR
ncbi:MAG: T9SS type A sorting domain-containing protein, partial [Prolixibacteraceae bacterium]|nr:T9SS type A sorting domain-containing protein [Prolixibacteraceae bacterium]